MKNSVHSISCPVGRQFDALHATCKSCPIECRERHGKKTVQRKREQICVHIIGNCLITTKYLDSLNAWNNQPRYKYMNIRKTWERVLSNAFYIWGKPVGKRLLQVKRIVKNRRHLILDRDNLVGSAKPLKDVLVRNGVLIDDSDEYLEFTVNQEVDPDNPRTEVILI